jgi:predicted nucleic acid-binding protein
LESPPERQPHARLGRGRSREPRFALTSVVDANVALFGADPAGGLNRLDDDLVGPPLLWPEVRSVLHVRLERGLITRADAEAELALLDSGRIRERGVRTADVWRIADQLGWTKTYDAEYLALASRLKAPLLTFDRRMISAATRVGVVARPPV